MGENKLKHEMTFTYEFISKFKKVSEITMITKSSD